MAYVNEEADGRVFEVPVFGEFQPFSWTRDRKKDAILFDYHTEREDPDRKYFYFQYKKQCVNIILDGREFVDPNTIKWKLVSIDVPKGLSKEEVLNELREAIEVYGCRGTFFMRPGKAIADF